MGLEVNDRAPAALGDCGAEGRRKCWPQAVVMPAPAALMRMRFDLGSVGYVAEEFVISGTADAFGLQECGATAVSAPSQITSSAPFRTRVVVFRPMDAARNCGTCVVEWLNCRMIVEIAAQWIRMHRHMIRKGMIWVGVSTERAGVEGEPANDHGRHLKALDPARYAGLSHPGDAFAFDIFSQAALLIKAGALSFASPGSLLATGSSQSARFLTTYINRIDPLAGVFDGFLLTGRHRSAATLEGLSVCGNRVLIREDVRVPVFVVQPETDPFGRMKSAEVRQSDTDRFRLWEIAGAAHADSYVTKVGYIDDGLSDVAVLAGAYRLEQSPWPPLKAPMNASPAFHFAHHAALQHLETWVKAGVEPPIAQPISGHSVRGIDRDELGIALGGVRTPWADCPAQIYSGENDDDGEIACLYGKTHPLAPEVLARLYPRGVDDYLTTFGIAMRSSIDAGFTLPDDEGEHLQLARALFPAKS